MKITRLDDFQSWALTGGGHHLLLDPWLVDDLVLGPRGCWVRREHEHPAQLRPRDIGAEDLLVLTSARPDHAHLPTLRALNKRVRVIGPPAAMRLVRELGFVSTIALGRDRIVLDGRLALSAVPLPFPYRMHNTASVLIEALDQDIRLLVAPRRLPARLPSEIDVLLTSVQQVRALGMTLSGDLDTCLALAREARVRWILATRTDPCRGLVRAGRRLCRPDDMDAEAFAATVAMHLGAERGRWLLPGQSLQVTPRVAAASLLQQAIA